MENLMLSQSYIFVMFFDLITVAWPKDDLHSGSPQSEASDYKPYQIQ